MTRIGNWKLENRNWCLGSTGAKAGTPVPASLLLRMPLGALRLGVIFFLSFVPSAPAQSLDKPTQTVDEDITAFGFAPDGRIAYSVRRLYHNKKYE